MPTTDTLPVGAAILIGNPEGDETPRLAHITAIRFYLESQDLPPGLIFEPDQVFTIDDWFKRRRAYLAAEASALDDMQKELVLQAAHEVTR